jgi:hypothetical protein
MTPKLLRQGADDQARGQALVLFAISLVLILSFAALVVDLGMLRNDRQNLVNALDAGALAGGTTLPVTGSAAEANTNSLIDDTVAANYKGSSTHTISYACLIGVDSNGAADLRQVLAGVCDPSHSLGRAAAVGDFSGAGSTRTAACDPSAGDTCNVVVVSGSATTQYGFARVVGVNSGSTGTIVSAACNGPCGSSLDTPVDLVIIVDRTASMSSGDIVNVQAGANAVLSVYDPAIQRVAIATIGPSRVNGSGQPATAACPNGGSASNGQQVYGVGMSPSDSVDYFGPAPTDLFKWVPVGFTGTDTSTPAVTFSESYSTLVSGTRTVNASSTIAKALSCVESYTRGTNLDTPVRMAAYYLQHYGRPGVTKGIILETDGTPQAGDGSAHYTCDQANAAATAVKALADNITIYTIGYGISGANCPTRTGGGGNTNANETVAWSGQSAASLLQSMASGPTRFYNAPASSAVADAFRSAAQDLAQGGNHLIRLYPNPVVTAVSSGGAPVTITGQFLTGATSVVFGSAPATIQSNTDTSIRVTPPAGTSGTTVSVIVTTAGGSSPITNAARYTYP